MSVCASKASTFYAPLKRSSPRSKVPTGHLQARRPRPRPTPPDACRHLQARRPRPGPTPPRMRCHRLSRSHRRNRPPPTGPLPRNLHWPQRSHDEARLQQRPPLCQQPNRHNQTRPAQPLVYPRSLALAMMGDSSSDSERHRERATVGGHVPPPTPALL